MILKIEKDAPACVDDLVNDRWSDGREELHADFEHRGDVAQRTEEFTCARRRFDVECDD